MWPNSWLEALCTPFSSCVHRPLQAPYVEDKTSQDWQELSFFINGDACAKAQLSKKVNWAEYNAVFGLVRQDSSYVCTRSTFGACRTAAAPQISPHLVDCHSECVSVCVCVSVC
eukprot:1358786-Amphidinium_carterae.1